MYHVSYCPKIKANFALSITKADPGDRAVLDVGSLPLAGSDCCATVALYAKHKEVERGEIKKGRKNNKSLIN